jgi:hypothetical protein
MEFKFRYPVTLMKTLRNLILLPLLPFALSGCGAVVGALVDSAFEREHDKDRVRAHLRHGDSVEQAQRGAFEDEFFEEMQRMD